MAHIYYALFNSLYDIDGTHTQSKLLPIMNLQSYISYCICDLLGPGLYICHARPGRVAQSVGHLTPKSGVLGSIPGLATYFRFSFRFFKKGSCQLLAKVCARSTG